MKSQEVRCSHNSTAREVPGSQQRHRRFDSVDEKPIERKNEVDVRAEQSEANRSSACDVSILDRAVERLFSDLSGSVTASPD